MATKRTCFVAFFKPSPLRRPWLPGGHHRKANGLGFGTSLPPRLSFLPALPLPSPYLPAAIAPPHHLRTIRRTLSKGR
eukprot:364424-Chlamydomonas_euryale.AAC.4